MTGILKMVENWLEKPFEIQGSVKGVVYPLYQANSTPSC